MSEKQDKIIDRLNKALKPFLKTLIGEDNWYHIINSIREVVQECKDDLLIFCSEEICHNTLRDYIFEYDIDYKEAYYVYCHLRDGHLSITINLKEF